ncbi:hypothetical protein J1614_001790 [Plenodomus biglobosus]|nr:hypothetical protein J1614_001790 [Plenodomus biglobosus]
MSSNELDLQSMPAATRNADEPENECQDVQFDHEGPLTKSGVTVDMNALMQNVRFPEGCIVHMSVIANGARDKGTFMVYKVKYDKRQGACVYQLADAKTGKQLYNKGQWYSESALKMERSA